MFTSRSISSASDTQSPPSEGVRTPDHAHMSPSPSFSSVADASIAEEKVGGRVGDGRRVRSRMPLESHATVLPSEGGVIVFVGKVPQEWWAAPSAVFLNVHNRNFAFAGEQIHMLVHISPLDPAVSELWKPGDQHAGDEEPDDDDEEPQTSPQASDAHGGGEKEGAPAPGGGAPGIHVAVGRLKGRGRTAEAPPAPSPTAAFVKREGAKRRSVLLLESALRSHFYVRVIDPLHAPSAARGRASSSETGAFSSAAAAAIAGEQQSGGSSPLKQQQQQQQREEAHYRRTSSGGAQGQGQGQGQRPRSSSSSSSSAASATYGCTPIVMEKAGYDPAAAGGLARRVVGVRALPNGDVAVLLEVTLATDVLSPDALLEVLQFERFDPPPEDPHFDTSATPSSSPLPSPLPGFASRGDGGGGFNAGPADPTRELLQWLLPLDPPGPPSAPNPGPAPGGGASLASALGASLGAVVGAGTGTGTPPAAAAATAAASSSWAAAPSFSFGTSSSVSRGEPLAPSPALPPLSPLAPAAATQTQGGAAAAAASGPGPAGRGATFSPSNSISAALGFGFGGGGAASPSPANPPAAAAALAAAANSSASSSPLSSAPAPPFGDEADAPGGGGRASSGYVGNEGLLSFRGQVLEPQRYAAARCGGLRGLYVPGRRWARALAVLQPVLVESYSSAVNTHDVLCILVQNVVPASAAMGKEEVTLTLDAITLESQAQRSSTPATTTSSSSSSHGRRLQEQQQQQVQHVACLDTGGSSSPLPGLLLRPGEQHSFLLRPAAPATAPDAAAPPLLPSFGAERERSSSSSSSSSRKTSQAGVPSHHKSWSTGMLSAGERLPTFGGGSGEAAKGEEMQGQEQGESSDGLLMEAQQQQQQQFYSVVVSCRCSHSGARLLYRHPLTWHPKPARELLLSVSLDPDSPSEGAAASPGACDHFHPKTVTVRATNLTRAEMSLTLLAPASLAATALSRLSFPATPADSVGSLLPQSPLLQRQQQQQQDDEASPGSPPSAPMGPSPVSAPRLDVGLSRTITMPPLRRLESIMGATGRAPPPPPPPQGGTPSSQVSAADLVAEQAQQRSHLWLQSVVPIGKVPPLATAEVKCQVLPLLDGLLTLDTLHVASKRKNKLYIPENPLQMFGSVALPSTGTSQPAV